MKKFTTLKVGYTAGAYGCSGEYFTTIVLTGDNVRVFNFYGMYGADERVNRLLKDAGYESFYTPSDFGKMTQKDVRARGKFWESEYQAIETVQDFINGKELY
jgi:hypothetical protein